MASEAVFVTKHRTVLHIRRRPPSSPHQVTFDQYTDPGESLTIPAGFVLESSVWAEMGRPTVITLSVEPGDLLNPGAPYHEAVVDAEGAWCCPEHAASLVG